ncbi:MAG: hypothetical protein CMJ46_11915, partial [Planctomyces sp.]|nr:hypothetical protein [Planctomyces sp.]
MIKMKVSPFRKTLAVWLGCVPLVGLMAMSPPSLLAQDVSGNDITIDNDVEAPPVVEDVSNYLPADALGLVRFGDVAAFREGWKNSSFGAQIDDPALKDFFDGVLGQLDTLKTGLGVDVVELIQQVDGELSIGLMKNSAGELSVVAVSHFADETAAEAWIEELTARLQAEQATETTVEINSTPLHSWKRTNPDAVSNLSYFVLDNQVVFSDDLQTLAETYRRGTTDTATDKATLSTNENYQHVMSRIAPGTSDSGFNWYVNPREMLRTAVSINLGGNEPPPQMEEMIGAIGVDQVKGIGGTQYLGEAGLDSVSTTYGYVDTPVKGFLKALTMPATQQAPPQWVKEDVSLYSQMNWSVDRLVDTMREVVDQQRGEGTFDKSLGSLKITSGDATLSELASVINGPMHVAAEIPQSASELFRQKAIFGFEIREPALIRDMLQEAAANRDEAVEKFGTTEMLRVRMDLGEALPGLNVLPQMELGIAVTDEAVLFSPNADYLAGTLGGDRA